MSYALFAEAWGVHHHQAREPLISDVSSVAAEDDNLLTLEKMVIKLIPGGCYGQVVGRQKMGGRQHPAIFLPEARIARAPVRRRSSWPRLVLRGAVTKQIGAVACGEKLGF